MDLVASYDSEVDALDTAGMKATSKAAESSKTVDIIELDSDSDIESVSAVEESRSKISSKCSKKLSMNSKPIHCIDLENNNGSGDTSSASSRQIETLKFSSESSEKRIDYLNLEGSDSDEESETADKNMSCLMDAASTLSSMPYGPRKPSDTIESSKLFCDSNTFEKDFSNIVPMSNINTDMSCGSARNTPDFIQSNISQGDSMDSPNKKRFKGDTFIETGFQNVINDSGTEKDACMYREDERVIEASQKNVVCRIPRQIIQTHEAHSSIITSLSWCIPKFSYLYLSASLDGSVKIWDLFSKTKPVQCITSTMGINAAKWSLDGGQIVAGGHGEKAFVLDVQTGRNIVAYDIYNVVTSLEIHPYMEDVFLCGTRNAILGFDIRVNTTFPIRSFFAKCEEVLDIVFLDENEFICSTNIVSHDSADRTIMAWDFSSGAILSNQIYLERYTCPSLKVHPTDSSFVAQTNGNYIASFSTTRPYTIKKKRYVGHKVSGYGIECDISPDGKYLASGDADGNVFFYNYANTSRVLCSRAAKKVAANRVKWHPAFSSTVITATYDGHIQLWK